MPAPKKTQTTLAPDGRRVTLSCRNENVQKSWQWHMRVTGKTLAVGLGVAGPDYVEITQQALNMTVQQELLYRGRPLMIMIDAAQENWMAAWKGAHHTLHLAGATPTPELSAVTGLLDQLSITDTTEGLVVTPQPGSDLVMWGLYGTKFTDAGMMNIYPLEDAKNLIPAEDGLAVEHGHVWVKALDVNGEVRGRKYLHAGGNSVALIDDDLGRIPRVTKAGQEELLKSLDIRWGR